MTFLAFFEAFAARAPFLLIMLVMALILYRAHRSDNTTFSVFHLVTDGVTGKGSVEKIGMIMAQLTVTWWFVDRAAKGLATVEEALVYGGLLGLARLADKWIGAKYGNEAKP